MLTLREGLDSYMIYCDLTRVGLGIMLMQQCKSISYDYRHHKVHEPNSLPRARNNSIFPKDFHALCE